MLVADAEDLTNAALSCRINEWHEERSTLFENTSIAYVYCSSTGTGTSSDYSSVLQSIIRQLSERKGQTHLSKLVARFHDLHARDRSNNAALTAKEIEGLLIDIFETNVDVRIGKSLLGSQRSTGVQSRHVSTLMTCAVPPNQLPVVLTKPVIDALDECTDWQKLLEILRNASGRHPGNLKVFCSSRPGVSLEKYFPDRTRKLLTEDLTVDDMERYVRQEIFSRETPRRLLGGRYPDIEEKLALTLLKSAGGM